MNLPLKSFYWVDGHSLTMGCWNPCAIYSHWMNLLHSSHDLHISIPWWSLWQRKMECRKIAPFCCALFCGSVNLCILPQDGVAHLFTRVVLTQCMSISVLVFLARKSSVVSWKLSACLCVCVCLSVHMRRDYVPASVTPTRKRSQNWPNNLIM